MAVAPSPDVLMAFGLRSENELVPLEGGHIHATWRLRGRDSPQNDAVVQRVNDAVFRGPHELMANLDRLEPKLVATGVPTVRWHRTSNNSLLHRDTQDRLWRAYRWIDGEVHRAAADLDAVRSISRAFGLFAGALADEPLDHYVEVVPSFHDFVARERAWRFAVLRDDANRFQHAQPEVERASRILERVHELDEYEAWCGLPQRIVHNDAKAANIVWGSDGVLTVIDLDTTMPGPLLADIGELVRTLCRSASEHDYTAASTLHIERFGLVLRGWLEGYGRELDAIELEALPIAGIMLTVENALRFLSDYLDGDIYFPVTDPDQNRARFRAQIGHAQALLDGVNDLRRVVAHERARLA